MLVKCSGYTDANMVNIMDEFLLILYLYFNIVLDLLRLITSTENFIFK